jgi:2-polyprenyl-3-methyl-5-hydroxy-6-metoxy-1,4-benzoquinol methylase
LENKIAKYCEYTLLDIGTRTGAGANLLAQLFYDFMWGYDVKIKVDTTDIDSTLNEYCKSWPYINECMNKNIFDIPDNSYDFIYCSHVIEHLDNPIEFVHKATGIARHFALFYCPYNQIDPPWYHKTIDDKVINQCNLVYVEYIDSVSIHYGKCILFICNNSSL